MSYDVSLRINTGNGSVEVVDCGNYTCNCSPMWNMAVKAASGGEVEQWRDLDGKLAGDVFAMLALAVQHMRDPANREAYLALNPKNGWGEYQSAFEYFRGVAEACEQHPLCTLDFNT